MTCIHSATHPIGNDLKDITKTEVIQAKLDLLNDLTRDTLELGRSQWCNRSILRWIDEQKNLINKEVENLNVKI